jgi:hypothetical protein
MSSPEIDLEKKKLAAIVYALSWTRGVLSDVLDGDFSREQAQRVYDASAMRHIAESIGLTEADFKVDSEQLTEAEKHKIQGYDTA